MFCYSDIIGISIIDLTITILLRPLTSHAEIASSVIPSGIDRVFRFAVQLVVFEAAKRGP